MVEKRNVHTYKVTDKVYKAARKHAKDRSKMPLATVIEIWLKAYAEGYSVGIVSGNKIL